MGEPITAPEPRILCNVMETDSAVQFIDADGNSRALGCDSPDEPVPRFLQVDSAYNFSATDGIS